MKKFSLIVLLLVIAVVTQSQTIKFINIDSCLNILKVDSSSIFYDDSYLSDFVKLRPSLGDSVLKIKPNFDNGYIIDSKGNFRGDRWISKCKVKKLDSGLSLRELVYN